MVYELPGDHSSGVHSGKTTKNGTHRHATSREARSKVTWDMFSHWLVRKDFAGVARVDEFDSLDAYCRIANDDLAGVQFDGKKSGFSFLQESRASAGHDFTTADANLRKHKGRGHMVPSSQVRDGHGLFVNARHRVIYESVLSRLQIAMRDRQNTVLGQYPNILEWINHNRNAGC